MEAPGETDAQVVVPVLAMVVVDVEALVVEVADVDNVAVRVHKFARSRPCHWKLRPIKRLTSFSCILFGSSRLAQHLR